MSISVIDIVSQGDATIAAVNDWKQRVDALQAELDELYNANPLPSNAEDVYNRLKSERDVIGDEYNTYTGIINFNNLIRDAPGDVQNDPAVIEIRESLREKNRALVDLAKTQKNSTASGVASLPNVKKKIEDAAEAAVQNPPPPPPPGEGGGNDDGRDTEPPAPPTDGSKPGRRLQNPLGYFSSVTYQISLYMCSPQGYNLFVDGGKISLPPAGQYILIAQSGGIHKNKRNANLPYDYYIENLRMDAAIGLNANGSETLTTNMEFQIIEPYGFSLPTKLKQAGEELIRTNATSADAGDYEKMKNQTKQTFILGIRFFGYDSEGNIMSATNSYDGRTLDPTYNQTSSQGLFERFFDIRFNSFKFRMDGKAVTYNIKAATLPPGAAAGVQLGVVPNPITTQGQFVKDMLDDLIDKLNKEQQKLYTEKSIFRPVVYSIDYSVKDFEEIYNQSMLSPEEVEKFKWPFSEPQNTNAVNPKIAERGASVPNNSQITIKHDRGSSILHCINKIIMQSSYLRNSLSVVYKNNLQPNQLNPSKNENRPDTKKTFRWYTCSPELYNPRWDSAKSAWAYDIRYLIKPYDTPIVQSAYANELPDYPGPYKRYDYWYTGENSEIISYEQEYNNTFFTVTLDPRESVDGQGQGGPTDTAQVPQQPVNADTQGSTNTGLQSQANAVTSIKDPGAFAKAKITIMGDPDLLMQTSETSKDINATFRKYFGADGYTINPTSGQVFIEISFKEPIDYNTDQGFMDINKNIIFWEYPANVREIIKGVSYRITTIKSSFASGKFTQVIEAVLNTFRDPGPRNRTTE